MATFKVYAKQPPRADGFCRVYIRVTQNRKIAYIKTDKVVHKDSLTKTGEIKDIYVMNSCTQKILEFNDRLNKQNTTHWDVKDIVSYLETCDSDICFSDYARKYIDKMINEGHARNAKNYKLALENFEIFVGTNKVMISHLTSNVINKWVTYLGKYARAKEMYPICLRQVFKAAQLDYNDYDTGLMRIKTNPWMRVAIPKADETEKRAISPEQCREFFAAPIPDSKMRYPTSELGRDVAMMVLCLAGINTVDLHQMKKENYQNGILKYHRAKTRSSRSDGAYTEMRVPAIIQPLFDKYLDRTDDDHLFDFYTRLTTSDSFSANVNRGIKQICESMGIPKEEQYCVYTFRHTWATVAQNDIRAHQDTISLGMNHSIGSKVTRRYIKFDYSPAWELNEKVIEFIFFSDKPSVAAQEKAEEDGRFRLSYRFLVQASAYHIGKKVAELADVGFNNVEEVIAQLVSMLPEDIPNRSTVIFKITNIDKDQTVVYQRQKGKGF